MVSAVARVLFARDDDTTRGETLRGLVVWAFANSSADDDDGGWLLGRVDLARCQKCAQIDPHGS